MKLKDQVAIVTGGARAIGRTIALRLAQEGSDVVLADLESTELHQTAVDIESTGRRALAIVTDVSDEAQVATLAERTIAECGRIDLLVNNAGVIGPTAAVQDVSRTDWDRVLAVNLTGAFLCAKAVLPTMVARRQGRIVNIASIAGKQAYPLRSPYAVSKWGLIGLTLTLAKEAGPAGIQVNAVCPGPVTGERMRTLIATRATELGRSVEEVTQEYVEQTLLGRFVDAEDVAGVVAFLASDAGKNITGQTLDVTAGYGL